MQHFFPWQTTGNKNSFFLCWPRECVQCVPNKLCTWVWHMHNHFPVRNKTFSLLPTSILFWNRKVLKKFQELSNQDSIYFTFCSNRNRMNSAQRGKWRHEMVVWESLQFSYCYTNIPGSNHAVQICYFGLSGTQKAIILF